MEDLGDGDVGDLRAKGTSVQGRNATLKSPSARAQQGFWEVSGSRQETAARAGQEAGGCLAASPVLRSWFSSTGSQPWDPLGSGAPWGPTRDGEAQGE